MTHSVMLQEMTGPPGARIAQVGEEGAGGGGPPAHRGHPCGAVSRGDDPARAAEQYQQYQP